MGVLEMLQGPAPGGVFVEPQTGLPRILRTEPEPEETGEKTAAQKDQDALACTASAQPGVVG